MPYKEGGGGKQQPYNDNNGEYVRNPQCEEDEKNLVFIKMFGLKTNKPIAFPEFGIHDDDYCDLIIKYCLDTKFPIIEEQKITNYLLKFREKDDKSKFLNSLGYNLSNWQELENQILQGTEFKKKRKKFFNEKVFSINTETLIYDVTKHKYCHCTTGWAIEKNFKVRLVTLIPEEYKDE